eukprot:m.266535 g.266535  ORF g.266535 m.266535 type:complete len:196 (-) comp67912_c0_seq1:33-620(-)
MKQVLLLLAEGFEIYEASVFIDVFGWNNQGQGPPIKLITCGMQSEVTSTFGVTLKVDMLLKDVNVDEFDALAVPGGFELKPNFYVDAFSTEFGDVIRHFNNQKKLISSVCTGGLALGSSGILKGRRGTTYHLSGGNRLRQLAEFGVNVVDNTSIVVDTNVTTSWAPVTAMEVAFQLLENLTSKLNSDDIRSEMGF